MAAEPAPSRFQKGSSMKFAGGPPPFEVFGDETAVEGEGGGKPVAWGGPLPRMQRQAPTFDAVALSEDLIEEKVSSFARKVVTLLADAARADMALQAAQVKTVVDKVMTMIENKIDREFVERMCNKFRVLLADLNEKVENVRCSFLEWVTRDELEAVLQTFAGVVGEVRDTAATTGKYGCLLCGRKRSHVAGMMLSGEGPQATIPPNTRPRTSTALPRRPIPRPLSPGHEVDIGPTQRARDVVHFLATS
jgi:hypothetical protein